MRTVSFGVVMALLAGCGGEADPAAGGTVYAGTCAACHGADGTAAVGGAADLTVVIPEMTDAQIQTVVLNGTGEMPAQTFSSGDMANLIAYLRDEFPGGS